MEKKYFKIFVFFFIFLFSIFFSLYFLWVKDNKSYNYNKTYTYQIQNIPSKITTISQISDLNNLYAKYAVLMDASNRRILFEKLGYEQVPMASTTKIMTLLVTLENANLNDIVNVSSYAASMPDVQLGIRAEEKFRLKDLLYSLMLESHNDVAVAIAEHVAGSTDKFAVLMNKKAKELGAYHTNFVTPNGLDALNHYTTAYDLALIANYAIENNMFCNIIKTPTYTFHEQTRGRTFTVNNKDRFLVMYDGAIGIKTGFTGNAGYCFVGAAKQGDKKMISVVLASGWPPHKEYKWKDTIKLMNYGFREFEMKKILKKGTNFQKIKVENSIEENKITPYAKDSISLLLNSNEKVTFEIKVPCKLYAPVSKDDIVGKMIVKINDKIYKVIPLFSDQKCNRITYIYILKKLFLKFF